MMAVGRDARTSSGCQWQWQSTWLAIWFAVAGETSTSWASGGGRRVDARQIVADDGLQMAVAQETPWTKLRGVTLR